MAARAKTIAVSDPIGDMLARIRNANERTHGEVALPSSRIKEEIARILVEEGFVEEFRVEQDGPRQTLILKLKYKGKRHKQRVIQGLKRVSRPSRRVYVGADEIPQVMGGLGVAVLSTSQGVMTGHEAQKRHVGGELLCHVW